MEADDAGSDTAGKGSWLDVEGYKCGTAYIILVSLKALLGIINFHKEDAYSRIEPAGRINTIS